MEFLRCGICRRRRRFWNRKLGVGAVAAVKVASWAESGIEAGVGIGAENSAVTDVLVEIRAGVRRLYSLPFRSSFSGGVGAPTMIGGGAGVPRTSGVGLGVGVEAAIGVGIWLAIALVTSFDGLLSRNPLYTTTT